MCKIDEERINAAFEYAKKMHEGQTRRGGEPYIIHPLAVAKQARKRGYGTEYIITALFHDLLEDTSATEQEILALSNARVLEAVKLLTKFAGYDMQAYVCAIKKNEIAFAIKGLDRLDNLQAAIYTDEDFKQRYIAETKEWYYDFLPEIPPACEALEKTLNK